MQSKPRTPSKIRARRESVTKDMFDEIPTRDVSLEPTGSRQSYVFADVGQRDSIHKHRRSYPDISSNIMEHQHHARRHSEDMQFSRAGYPFFENHHNRIHQPFGNNNTELKSATSINSTAGTPVLSNNIYKLWKNKQLCDVEIIADGEIFLAHKLVMAANCEKFARNALLYTNEKIRFEIPDIDARVVGEVVGYFYSGKLDINLNNVEQLVQVSERLGVDTVLNSCVRYLKNVTINNAVQHRVIAQRLGLSSVISHIDRFFHDHSASLVSNTSFLNSDFHTVYDVISSEPLLHSNELQKFHACAAWVNYNVERLMLAAPLMSLIRFTGISPTDLITHVESVSFMTENIECKDMLYNAFRHHSLFREMNFNHVPVLPAPPRSSVHERKLSFADQAINTEQDQSVSGESSNASKEISEDSASGQEASSQSDINLSNAPNMSKLPPNKLAHYANKFKMALRDKKLQNTSTSAKVSKHDLASLDDFKESNFKIVTNLRPSYECISNLQMADSTRKHGMSSTADGNTIFIVGGSRGFETDNPETQNSMHSYDMSNNCWSTCSSIPVPLHHCSVTYLNGKIYVIGGQRSDSINTVPLSECYSYNISSRKWKNIGRLRTARTKHVSVVLNGVIYTIGGEDCVEMSLKSMEYYNFEEKRWNFTKPMTDARVGLAAIGHKGRIMAAGGMTDTDEALLLDTVEVYEPRDNTWNYKFPLPVAICSAAMAEIHGTVYLVGGYVMKDKEQLSLDSIFRYRDETDNWEGFHKLRVPRHDAVAVALDTRLYIIGGTSSASNGHALTNVECLDVINKSHVDGIAPLVSSGFGISGCVCQMT